MHAKFEALHIEAHSLISRHLNRYDRFEMRQTCRIWRNFLKYQVVINKHTASEILYDVKSGKSLLDFKFVKLETPETETRERARFFRKLRELLTCIGDRIIHLVCEYQDILDISQIPPNLKTLKVNTYILTDLLNANVSYELERLNEPPLSYEMANIKNSKGISERFLIESCGRYLKDIVLREYLETTSDETLQRAISTWNQLELLNCYRWCSSKLLKMCAIHLPATAPLKILQIGIFGDNIFDIFCKKWAHSLEIIELAFAMDLSGVTPIASLKHLRALRTLNLVAPIQLPPFELYNAIATKNNNNLMELRIDELFIDEEELILILGNLPRLRKLQLNCCWGALTDHTLATIFNKLTRLQELKLVECFDCTDAGFLGFGDTPYPISRLRGLQYLEIGFNRNVTERIFTEIVRLKELRQIGLPNPRLYSELLKVLNDDCSIGLRRQL